MKPTVFNGMNTPWGKAQHTSMIIDGIGHVGTAGHGGIKVRADLNELIPEYMRAEGGWYEEDCDWSIPFVVFAAQLAEGCTDEYTMKTLADGTAKETLKNWKPDAFEQFYGVVLARGESFLKDERFFHADHANDLVCISATMAHDNIMVLATCTIGGRGGIRGNERRPERFFLVPQAEYDTRGRFGFVVDPSRYQEVNAKGVAA